MTETIEIQGKIYLIILKSEFDIRIQNAHVNGMMTAYNNIKKSIDDQLVNKMNDHAYTRDHINSITLCPNKSWAKSAIECIIWCDDLSTRFIHAGYDRYEEIGE